MGVCCGYTFVPEYKCVRSLGMYDVDNVGISEDKIG